jgi:Na+/H+ antiporter NhaD/arsenite permease-like protein
MVILWGSALFSSILNNIPFVLVMIPLIQKMIVNTGGTADAHNPLYWALAFGACLGGNGTIIGASANVLACSIGNRNNYKISFVEFMKWGMPFMILSIFISSIYIWLRYF